MYDAHVHMGYYSRLGCEEPFYYSPRRVVGLLSRCGIGEFIVSSTCAQVACIPFADILREAREMRRIAGSRAHQFFWLSGRFYDADPNLKALDTGIYEGLKLHELETPWLGARRRDLMCVLAIAVERGLPVQFHCGGRPCDPITLAKVAAKFPSVRFDFAHCCPMDEMARVVADLPNVWTDVACLPDKDWERLADYDWHGRLLFGSDFPVYHSKFDGSLSSLYNKLLALYGTCGAPWTSSLNGFLKGNNKSPGESIPQEILIASPSYSVSRGWESMRRR